MKGEAAREIVRRSGSNLAFALAVLPREKRADMQIFYAFCRDADDFADSEGLTTDQRQNGLRRWRAVVSAEASVETPIESEVADLIQRRSLDRELFKTILDGVEMDLEPQLFQGTDDLKQYCYRVAGAVGLVSIELFGATNSQSATYAEELGYALQWTNILRDVGSDAREGRIYLPVDSLGEAGLSPEDLLSLEPRREPFLKLMAGETARAREFFDRAVAVIPSEDRRALRSAELMRRIYQDLLNRIESDGFRVFEKRYRPSKFRAVSELIRAKLFC
ncbi:MAG: squalene/phytoene synthase family protein [Verrucomicrobiota bacterium]